MTQTTWSPYPLLVASFQGFQKSDVFLKARIHCGIFLSDYFMKQNLTLISLHVIWLHEFCIKYVKRNPPRTIIRKKYPIPTFATCPCCGHWLTCFSLKGYSYRRLFFHYFTRDKNGFIHCRIQLILSNK